MRVTEQAAPTRAVTELTMSRSSRVLAKLEWMAVTHETTYARAAGRGRRFERKRSTNGPIPTERGFTVLLPTPTTMKPRIRWVQGRLPEELYCSAWAGFGRLAGCPEVGVS